MTPARDTRGQIMDAFADQLATTGYSGISLVGVARTAGIQKPSVYHHFPGGKEEIYREVTLRFIARLSERVTAAIATDGTLDDKLIALAAASADHTAAAVSFEQRIYDTLDQVSEETRTLVSRRYVDGVLHPVVGFFARAVDGGEIDGEPEFLMNSFLHLARAADLINAHDDASRLVKLFMNGARAK